jgi:hypothetical protein
MNLDERYHFLYACELDENIILVTGKNKTQEDRIFFIRAAKCTFFLIKATAKKVLKL